MTVQRIGLIAGGLLWASLVFVVTYWLTFPSQTLADRARWETPQVMGKAYSLDLAGVSPWWVGVSAQDAKVYKTPRARGGEPATPGIVAIARDVRVRASLWSLVRRTPFLNGSVTLTEGTVDYAVGFGAVGDGELTGLVDLDVSSTGLPVSELLILALAGSETEVDATGAVDLSLALQRGEDGMVDADGEVDLSGADIVLSNIVIPKIGPLGMDVPIDVLELNAVARDGKAVIERGRIESELFRVVIEGEVNLRDPLDRSLVDLEITVDQLGEQLKMFEGALQAAKHADGRWHYTCKGMLFRLSATTCMVPVRERAPGRTTPSSRGGRGVSSPAIPPPRPTTASDEARKKLRDEQLEKLEERRAQRAADRAAQAEKDGMDDEEQVDDEDEEFLDEDLPPEEDDFDGFED